MARRAPWRAPARPTPPPCSSRCIPRWAIGCAPTPWPRSVPSTGRRVWDLYAGIGETTAALARAGAEVESVESDRRAVAEAEAAGPLRGDTPAGSRTCSTSSATRPGDHQSAPHRDGRPGGRGARAPAAPTASSTSPAIRPRSRAISAVCRASAWPTWRASTSFRRRPTSRPSPCWRPGLVKYIVTLLGREVEVEVDGDRVTVGRAGSTRPTLGSVPGTPVRQLLLDGRSEAMALEGGGAGRWALTRRGERVELEVVDERTRHIRSSDRRRRPGARPRRPQGAHARTGRAGAGRGRSVGWRRHRRGRARGDEDGERAPNLGARRRGRRSACGPGRRWRRARCWWSSPPPLDPCPLSRLSCESVSV